jgi:hypothetical protein
VAKRKLKSGADAHEFTKEDAAKGGRARAESFQERRQAAEHAAGEQLVSGLEKALKRLEAMLDSENQQVAFRAVAVYLDRALGKAALPAQGGRHDVTRSEAVAIAREEHALKIDAEVPAAREMVARLIERRARELAAGAEDMGRLLPTDLSN